MKTPSPSEGRFPPWLLHRAPLLLFLALYALTVALTYRQFGTTWDEGDVYMRGARLRQSFATGNPGFLVQKHEDPDGNEVYNHTYGMLLGLCNPDLDLSLFHGRNLAVASLGYIAAYELAFAVTGGPWAALLGPVALLLNPRFSGDTPSNPKDAPYAVFFIAFLALLVGWPEKRFVLKTILLGLLLFLACAQRLSGFFLLVPAALWWCLLAPEGKKTRPAVSAARLGTIAVMALALLYATWPYLRLAPWKNFWEVFSLSLRFPYNGKVLFLGQIFKVHDLPPTYPWVWLGIAIPLGLLAFAAIALALAFRKARHPATALVTVTLLLQAAAILFFRPALYDGLRHLLYLLPLVSFLAALGVWEIGRRLTPGWPRQAFAACVSLYAASVGFRMADLHPYEYLYFNGLVGGLPGAEGKFETDYWGAAYREAAIWLKTHELTDPKCGVTVYTKGNAIQTLAYLCDRPVRWGPMSEADYFISSTRWNEFREAGDRSPLYTVSRDGVPLCYVYRLK
jgi:hypothetical protein